MRGRFKFETGQWNAIASATAVLLAFSFFFGGASRLNELRLAFVELAALPLLVLLAARAVSPRPLEISNFAVGIVALTAAVPLVQLIPLPASVWTSLPGRDQAALALELAGITATWSQLSLTPDETWRAFLALVPPIVMFGGVIACSGAIRLKLIYGLLIFTVASVLFAAAQAAAGEQLYIWPTTSAGTVVGFFANRNHLATLCLLSLPFAAVIGSRAMRHRKQGDVTLWLAGMFIALMIVALAVIRSRMGVALLGPTLAASLAAAWVASGRGRPKPLFLGLIGSIGLGVLAVSFFALGPLLERFDAASAKEGRFENWPTVIQAADTYLPFGSGLGSFDPVYRSVEPLERLDSTFFNQAHNDYLELWLETGWLGAALFIAFLIWFGRRCWSAWKAPVSTERDLQRAASVAIGVVLLHSAVDYPLRTETIAVLLALCCALLETAAWTEAQLSANRQSNARPETAATRERRRRRT